MNQNPIFKPLIQTETQLARYILDSFGVLIPDTHICPNHQTPWEAFCDAYFARSTVAVWKASRGLGGKTFLLSLLSLVEALTLKANVNLLGGSGEQSRRVLECMETFWKFPKAPKDQLLGEVAREMRFASGNQIEALMASQASVRGPHPQRLRLDEIDEMSLQILDSAMGQPMSSNGILSHVVQSSTHQYADRTMSECLKRASENGYSVFEWCYRENSEPIGWLTEAEKERKRSQMTKTTWDNEVELQEPNPESRAMDQDSIKKMFRRDLGEFVGEIRQYIEIEEPQSGAEYFTGADWAKELHYTIIYTLKKGLVEKDSKGKKQIIRPHRLVAFERLGREKWQSMIARYDDRLNRFGGSGVHDSTGIGDVVDDDITVSNSEGFDFRNAKERAKMLNDYCIAVESGEIEAPLIHYAETEHRLASNLDVYGSGHLPDTISAGALAYRAMTHRQNKTWTPKGKEPMPVKPRSNL